MQLHLLEIGEADLLSACPVALLLGVFTEDNNLERFLRISRKMLNTKYAILAFEDEPYVWYSDSNGFKAFHANPNAQLHSYFDSATLIDCHHHNYASCIIHEPGKEARIDQIYYQPFLYIKDFKALGLKIYNGDPNSIKVNMI